MTEHYYTHQPTAAHHLKEFSFELRGHTFRFTTDSGVFSKDRIDYGSVLLIEQMELNEDDEVLDMGCGYGPVGIAAAKLASKGSVLMADINERAVSLARKNLEKNHIHHAEAIVSDLFSNIPADRLFDAILTNPPIRAGKKTVHQLFEDAYSHLKEHGVLWVVIQKKQGAPSAMEKLKSLFPKVEKVKQDKGYWIIKATKM